MGYQMNSVRSQKKKKEREDFPRRMGGNGPLFLLTRTGSIWEREREREKEGEEGNGGERKSEILLMLLLLFAASCAGRECWTNEAKEGRNGIKRITNLIDWKNQKNPCCYWRFRSMERNKRFVVSSAEKSLRSDEREEKKKKERKKREELADILLFVCLF